MSPGGWSGRRVVVLTCAVLGALSIALLVLVPVLLVSVLKASTWDALANVATAYSGVATVISALALGGIATSLFLQWRQLRVSQMFALRERNFELLKLEIEHPDIFPLASTPGWRQRTYASLFVGQLASWWDVRAITADGLRRNAMPLFEVPEIRSWWRTFGPGWSARPTAHRRMFHRILDEVCAAADRRESPTMLDNDNGPQHGVS